MIRVAHFHTVGKYAARRQSFMMRVISRMVLSGKCLSAVFDMEFSPGAFGRCLINY